MAEHLELPSTDSLPARLGPWQTTAQLGEGNWSRVYQAQPIGLSAADPADYAIKQLRPELQHDPLAKAFLARENKIGSTVSHPHLLPVLDSGIAGQQAYLVMPRLLGFSPTNHGHHHPLLTMEQALWILRQISQGMHALHQHGWLHADIKPANIMVDTDGHATLFDFGLARKLGTAECSAKSPFVGTLAYSAPEMIDDCTDVSVQADIYSLGVTAYQLFTGKTPFWNLPPEQLAKAQQEQAPPSARKWVPSLYREINQLLLSMLAKQPWERPTLPKTIETLVRLEISTFTDQYARRASFQQPLEPSSAA